MPATLIQVRFFVFCVTFFAVALLYFDTLSLCCILVSFPWKSDFWFHIFPLCDFDVWTLIIYSSVRVTLFCYFVIESFFSCTSSLSHAIGFKTLFSSDKELHTPPSPFISSTNNTFGIKSICALLALFCSVFLEHINSRTQLASYHFVGPRRHFILFLNPFILLYTYFCITFIAKHKVFTSVQAGKSVSCR